MKTPRPYNVYRHKKTGTSYIVTAIAVDCTNSRHGTSVVIYERLTVDSQGYGGPFVRELHEFCDGRFELLHERPDC